jgi:pimeloyl-ACP methyl ester carboxylesterase
MDEKFTYEVQGRYRAMDCPVTVLWGQEDAWIPCEKGQILAELISDQPCLLVRNSGHLMQEDRPEAIVAAVLKQIGSV